jgi:arginyl-tRNA synthetase
VREAARDLAPSRVLFFVQELAELFQGYYTQTKQARDAILPMASAQKEAGWEASWDKQKTMARLAWIEGIRRVYRDALSLLGMSAPDEMRRDPRPEAADEAADASEAGGTP